MNIDESNMVASISNKPRWQNLPIFLAICFAAFAFGGLFRPGEWYAALTVPPWTPPNLAFPIVWAVLYICIAFAGWLIFASGNKTLKTLWVVQLVLNALWSWIFFGQHWVLLGAADIVLIGIVLVNLILKSWRAGEKAAASLLCPYLLWIMLATSLNVYIAVAN